MNKRNDTNIISAEDQQLKEDIKNLTIERLKASSEDMQISIGGEENLSKGELIESVTRGDEIGQEIMDIQVEFLRDMAEGKIYQDE